MMDTGNTEWIRNTGNLAIAVSNISISDENSISYLRLLEITFYSMIFLWYSVDQWVLWEVHEGSSFYVGNPVPLQIEDLQGVQSSPHLGSDLR